MRAAVNMEAREGGRERGLKGRNRIRWRGGEGVVRNWKPVAAVVETNRLAAGMTGISQQCQEVFIREDAVQWGPDPLGTGFLSCLPRLAKLKALALVASLPVLLLARGGAARQGPRQKYHMLPWQKGKALTSVLASTLARNNRGKDVQQS